MKNLKKWVTQIRGGTILLFLLMAIPIAKAKAFTAPQGIGLVDCSISSSVDVASQKATLRTALFYAAQADKRIQKCAKSITITTPLINMKTPLVIAPKNVDGAFVIEGKIPNSAERVLLNFDGMPAGAEESCAITFTGSSSHNITFKNIEIKNVHASAAICFKDHANHITMERMKISHLEHDGIVVDSTVSDLTITPDSQFQTIGGDAIQIKNVSIESNISIKATNRELVSEEHFTDPATGTALFADSEGIQDFSMQSITGLYVSSEADAHVLVSNMSPLEDGKYQITGAVVKKSLTCSDVIDPIISESIKDNLVNNVKQIQVYAVGLDAAAEGSPKTAAFLTYVTKQSACKVGASCSLGIGSSGTAYADASRFGGLFTFILDTKALLEKLNTQRTAASLSSLNAITKIVLVPELSNGTLATATEVKDITDIDARDTCANVDTGTDTDTNPDDPQGDEISGGGDIIIRWENRDQCRLARKSGTVNAVFDSDGDGIPDIYEDANGDCEFNPLVDFSDWSKIDTDSDGIPDLQELNGVSYEKINRTRQPSNNNVCSDNVCSEGVCSDNNVSCDADGDYTTNANEVDSDDDTISDGEEDRDRFYMQNRKAFYYRWQGIGNLEAILVNGEKVECTDDLAAADLSSVGTSYGIYRIKRDLSQKPELLQSLFGSQLSSEYILLRLTCRNSSVVRDSNFNGRKDAPTETDPYVSNQDEAGVLCRGEKQSDGQCIIPCQPNDIFQGMEDFWVDRDSAGRVTGLKRDSDQQFLLFKQSPSVIKNACGDMDDDGIPNCVENSAGTCDICSGGSSLGSANALGVTLCPYKKNTDGDALPDGIIGENTSSDPCPNDSRNTCDKAKFYESNPLLAFYLDRDGDGLSDGLEECSGMTPETTWPLCKPNGIINQATGLANRLISKTDPFKTDTDNDGAGDFLEVSEWQRYTNPADRDTDNDSLSDRQEVLQDASPNGTEYITSDGIKCDAVVTENLRVQAEDRHYGTDPQNPDTDEDGIQDGIEVAGQDPRSLNILDPIIFDQILKGTEDLVVSNPLSFDSDGDGLSDFDETHADGVMQFNESNPCVSDSDGDGKSDGDEEAGTRLLGGNDSQVCENGGMVDGFRDSDCDGVSDRNEITLGTSDRADRDYDDDGLLDGAEDLNGDGQIQINEGETNPSIADTDQDGLSDGDERTIGSKPHINDSDGDGLLDGIELGGRIDIASGNVVGSVSVHNFGTGAFTNPTNPDSDGDGLCDGRSPRGSIRGGGLTGDINCQLFEDANNNGVRDLCEFNPNQFCETDPLNSDSDFDGEVDLSEICHGGQCNVAGNMGRANQGRSEGCFTIAGSSNQTPTSILYLFGLFLIWNRWSSRKLKEDVATN